MDKYTTNGPKIVRFDQIYETSIRSKLEAIDLFLKENTVPFQLYEVADILEIETTELTALMQTLELEEITPVNFFSLLTSASSEICGLISRQFKYGHSNIYTPEIIAKIYKLNIHKVKNAFADLSTDFVTDVELMDVFKRIHIIAF